MSTSPAFNIRERILAQGLNSGVPVYVGTTPADSDNAITVYDTGGGAVNGDRDYSDPTLMIRVQHRDYEEGYDLLYDIRSHFTRSLGMSISDWHYTGFWMISDILRLNRDDQGREVFTLNLRAMRQRLSIITWEGGVTWDNGVFWT